MRFAIALFLLACMVFGVWQSDRVIISGDDIEAILPEKPSHSSSSGSGSGALYFSSAPSSSSSVYTCTIMPSSSTASYCTVSATTMPTILGPSR